METILGIVISLERTSGCSVQGKEVKGDRV
jgi:hypothetical protein